MKAALIAFAAWCLFVQPVQAQSVTLVAFNVENLFDTADDPDNPHDDTYLPLSVKQTRPGHAAHCDANTRPGFFRDQCKHLDWSASVYAAKLASIGNVIKAMPAAPDVIILPETENKAVLDDLAAGPLQGMGYTVVHLDSSDEPESRGIDVGMLTRLPVSGAPLAHPVDFAGDAETCGKTRDILQVAVTLPDGEPLHVFGVHFPSGGNPVECRIRAFATLNTLHKNLGENVLAVAAGDFNINCNEAPTGAFDRLMVRGNWYGSPLLSSGCQAPGSSKFVDRLLYNWNTWSFLDMIIVSGSLSVTQASEKNWFADLGSFGTLVVHGSQVMVDEDNKGFVEPRRFDPATGAGVSDHWPVGIRLLPRRS